MTGRRTIITVRILFILYLISVSCLCFLNLSFSSGMDIPSDIFGIRTDRVAHFLMFLPFYIIAVPTCCIDRATAKLRIWRFLLTILTGVCFSAFTELVQKYFLPAREGDIIDFLADLCGLMTGVLLYLLIVHPLLKRSFYRTDEKIS